jgi:hypothetical protein
LPSGRVWPRQRQIAWPIKSSCPLAAVRLLAVRIDRVGKLALVFLRWNLFLAWIPFLLSPCAAAVHDRGGPRPLLAVWVPSRPRHDGDRDDQHPLPAGSRRQASGVAEAPNVGPGGSACLRQCRIRDRKLIDQERTEIVRKLLGLALVAGIVVGVKKYLDNNPEAKRQVKEQANKAMGQAKHLAEEAGEKVRAQTSQAQNQVDSFTDSATPGSTSSASSVTTPHDPATGAPTTL